MFVSVIGTTAIFNGHQVQGWSSDGDALDMPDSFTPVAIAQGADGLMVASRTGMLGDEIGLKLMPNSISTQFFMQQLAMFMQGVNTIWEGSVQYNNGASVQCARGVLLQTPLGLDVGGDTAAMREFRFRFETIIPNFDGGQFDSPPQLS